MGDDGFTLGDVKRIMENGGFNFETIELTQEEIVAARRGADLVLENFDAAVILTGGLLRDATRR